MHVFIYANSQIFYIEGKDMVMPGEDVAVKLTMNKQMSLKTGQQFTIRSAGTTIGSGKVSDIDAL